MTARCATHDWPWAGPNCGILADDPCVRVDRRYFAVHPGAPRGVVFDTENEAHDEADKLDAKYSAGRAAAGIYYSDNGGRWREICPVVGVLL